MLGLEQHISLSVCTQTHTRLSPSCLSWGNTTVLSFEQISDEELDVDLQTIKAS